METENGMTREEMQEEQAKRLLEKMAEMEPDDEGYADLLKSYNSLMETSNKERELAASETANENDKKKNVVSVLVGIFGVIASFAFGFKTDKKAEEGIHISIP